MRRLVVAGLMVALSGFIALSYEIVWYRLLSFVSADPASTFGLLLAFYLTGLAFGALAVGAICRRVRPEDGRSQLAAVGVFVGVANLVGYAAGPLLGYLAEAGVWMAIFPVLSISAALLGGVLPLMTHYAVPRSDLVGSHLSWLYAANIVGAAGGSLLTGFVLLDLFSVGQVSLLLALMGIAIAAVLMLSSAERTRPACLATLAAVGLGVLLVVTQPLLLGDIYERLLYKTRYMPGSRLAEVVENRQGVVAVTAKGKSSAAAFTME